MRKIIKIVTLCASMIIASCAHQAGPALSDTSAVNDPYENWNRSVFSFNMFFDDIILEPVAIGYDRAVPTVVKILLRNELDYLNLPASFINSILQGDIDSVEHVFARFFINSTLGGIGLLDPATEFGFGVHHEDFGQTLAVWGVPDGRYYMAPFVGPLTLRDVGGRVIDFTFAPFTYLGSGNELFNIGQTSLSILDFRAQNIDTINGLKSSSEDYYAVLRSIYLQTRNADIENRDITEKPDLFVNFDAYDE